MLATIRSLALRASAATAFPLRFFVSNGLVNFVSSGLPDAAVREARERVRAAIKLNGFKFPVSRVTVNLAPADTKKAGTVYDLPIMLGILAATGVIRQSKSDCAFFGELFAQRNAAAGQRCAAHGGRRRARGRARAVRACR